MLDNSLKIDFDTHKYKIHNRSTSIAIMSNMYFESANDTLSVEMSTLVLSKMELIDLTDRVSAISSNLMVDQKIQLNYKGNHFKLKLISPIEGQSNPTVCGSNKIIRRKITTPNGLEYHTLVTKTNVLDCVDGSIDSIVLSHELKYPLIDHPEWLLAISAVKTMTNPQEFTTRIHEYKDRLLKSYTSFAHEIDETAYDMINLSLRFIGSAITKADLIKVIRLASSTITPNLDSKHYQDTLFSVAREIYRDPIVVNRFKTKSGFKKLLPSAIELSRSIYFKQVLPMIDTFYITDKIDGLRTLLQITEYSRRTELLGIEIISISNDLKYIQSFEQPHNLRGVKVSKTILDAEMIEENGSTFFHVFDIIMIDGRKVSNLPFKNRFKEFAKADALLKHHKLGRTKKFVKLTSSGYKQQLEQFYEEAQSKNYEIDGIIFTPEGLHYREAPKQKFQTNTEYYNTISFKWKPLEQSTIDFYLMKIAPSDAKALLKTSGYTKVTSETVYALCSGVDIDTFKKLRLEFFKGYIAPESDNSYQYFPIQFSPYDNSYMYVWTSKESDLDGRVAEFKFVDTHGKLLKKPEIIRMRDDRVGDVRKGEYFGNALKYSELIWHSIKYPLTFDMLGLDLKEIGGYFQSDSNEEYFAQRAFNSFVKNDLIDTYLQPLLKQGPASIIDLMCGKGQDLARVLDAGFTEVTMIDRDIDAIYELLQRKYNLRIKRKGASAQVHIRQVDFEESFESILNTTDLPQGVSAGMINFGIHYLAHDHSAKHSDLPLSEFFKLTNHTLRVGGRLVITCFDGAKIFKLLKDSDQWTTKNKKYSIKRAYTSNELTDLNQPIDVLLPFSGGSYYREYLVNFEFLTSIAAKHGFKVIASDSFSALFRQFKKNNLKVFKQLDAADLEYLTLYSFIVLERV